MSFEKITFGPNNDIPGYVIGDVASPAVMVIQEWWGVNDIIKAHAAKIAAQGYRCLVPDIYHGKIGIDKEEASHLLGKLDWQRAVEEVTEGVKYLKAGRATKVGCIGFCMGGALSLAAGQHSGIDAAIPFYGTPSPEICQPEKITAPTQFHFGALDDMIGFSDAATAQTFAEKIQSGGGTAEVHVYENCGHGFLNAGDEGTEKRQHMGFPEPSDEDQELAWSRVFAWFDKYLKA